MNNISVSEAIQQIRKNGSLEQGVKVEMESVMIDAMDAFKLGKHGIDVPESQIVYDDSKIAYDPDIDDVDWIRTNELIDGSGKQKIQVELELDKDVSNWVKDKNIGLKELLEHLIYNYYSTDKLVK